MVLKRVIAPLAVFLLISAPLLAAGYAVDLYGAFLGIGKTKAQAGGGGAIGIRVIDNFSILYRGMYTEAFRKTDAVTRFFYEDKKKYTHMMHMAGFEYVLVIPELRLGWRNSLMAGYSRTRLDTVDRETNFLESGMMSSLISGDILFLNLLKIRRDSDHGFAVAYWTGLQVNALPFLAPFIDIGIHKSFYDRDLNSAQVIGFHLMFGVRLSPGGD